MASWANQFVVKESCPIPTCQAKLTIIDQWRNKRGKNGKEKRFRFGHMMEIEIPQKHNAGWSVAIRFPREQERGAFQVFNGHFFHVYQTQTEVILFVHKKHWDNDQVNKKSFTVVADHLMTQHPPTILYYNSRVKKHFCFEDRKSRSGLSSLAGFAESPDVPLEEVSKIRIKGGRVVKTKKSKSNK